MTAGYFAPTGAVATVDEDDLDDHDFEPSDIVLKGDGLGSLGPYFEQLALEAQRSSDIARQARSRGHDPELSPEIPFAEDLASRVEALVGPENVAARIRELATEMGREELALAISKEVAAGAFGELGTREEAMDAAIRTGLAILTEGILVAPLEGVASVRIGMNADGTDYADVYFAGPIRAAGGTGQALSVLIADVVRRELGIGRYEATREEVERFKEEIPLYKRAAHLQYTPSPEEIELIVAHVPVCVNGEGTEREEVSGYRDLPRVETNQLRGGACLVIAEGLTLKAPKVLKHVEKLGLTGWEFLRAYVDRKQDKATGDESTGGPLITPETKYITELVAGRPVLSHPMATGGFRLRYGRARTAGLAATAVHPALLPLVDDFLAVGTQLKVERPGKGTVVTPCDELEPPIARLKDGSVVEVRTVAEAQRLAPETEVILDLGEMLVPFGEFLENNKRLPGAAWCPEWWRQVVAATGAEVPTITDDDAEAAFALAEATSTPLHPRFTLMWHDLAPDGLTALASAVSSGTWRERDLVLAADAPVKAALEAIGATHQVDATGALVLDARCALAVVRGTGHRIVDGAIGPDNALPEDITEVLTAVASASGVAIKPKAPCRIGARMGRPEKAAHRQMDPPVHCLFPLGQAGGMQRLVQQAAAAGVIGSPAEMERGRADHIEIGQRACPTCKEETLSLMCPSCREATRPVEGRPVPRLIPMADLLEQALDRVGLAKLPTNTKGVRGLISEHKMPEPLEKGILRAKHDLFVFKDGTCRFDMTDVPLTHFRPREIGTSVKRLRELGYHEDQHGEPLTRDDQVLELLPHDLVVNDNALAYLAKVATFVDDLLVRFYGLKPFYRLSEPSDLIGHLAVGLAPHTSGGVLCRIIGTTRAQVHFAHPYFHAGKRRNCDGDEDCVMLLLDGLINFSRWYLPRTRGGQMDAPLTLSTRIDPREIDKEAHNIETVSEYPIAFYEATERNANPREVEDLVETVGHRLGGDRQYTELRYTHDTGSLDEGPLMSAYKTIGSMLDKMEGQLGLAHKIRAVDEGNVASRVICDHFLPDIVGNLKAFSRQTMRCAKCNTKYRRVPLTGRCTRCKNKLTMTVHQASVRKYVQVSKQVAERYHVDEYTLQRLRLVEEAIESLFQNDKVKKATLTDFL